MRVRVPVAVAVGVEVASVVAPEGTRTQRTVVRQRRPRVELELSPKPGGAFVKDLDLQEAVFACTKRPSVVLNKSISSYC